MKNSFDYLSRRHAARYSALLPDEILIDLYSESQRVQAGNMSLGKTLMRRMFLPMILRPFSRLLIVLQQAAGQRLGLLLQLKRPRRCWAAAQQAEAAHQARSAESSSKAEGPQGSALDPHVSWRGSERSELPAAPFCATARVWRRGALSPLFSPLFRGGCLTRSWSMHSQASMFWLIASWFELRTWGTT